MSDTPAIPAIATPPGWQGILDEGEQIRLRKFNDDVDIAFRPGLVSREGSEKSEPQYAEPRRQIRLYPAEFAQQCVAIQRIVSHFFPSSKKVS